MYLRIYISQGCKTCFTDLKEGRKWGQQHLEQIVEFDLGRAMSVCDGLVITGITSNFEMQDYVKEMG